MEFKQNKAHFVPTQEDSEDVAARTLNTPREQTSKIDLVEKTIESYVSAACLYIFLWCPKPVHLTDFTIDPVFTTVAVRMRYGYWLVTCRYELGVFEVGPSHQRLLEGNA